jgi:hypothetical protein
LDGVIWQVSRARCRPWSVSELDEGDTEEPQTLSDTFAANKQNITGGIFELSDQTNVGEQLRLTENVLRNLIASVLEEKLGEDWIQNTGVTPERLDNWRRKRDEEDKKLATGNLETRLLYFADFYDLKTIILKSWDDFKEVFGEKKELEVLLSTLEDFRNPTAHARGLLPYQEHLAVGICGELRTKVARHRSKKETTQDCFPRIDSAYDNHGHTFPHKYPIVRPTLRVGDRIEVVVEATDPEAMPLEYRFFVISGFATISEQDWSPSNSYSLELTDKCIGTSVSLNFFIRSGRPYHAEGTKDDSGQFIYVVLPTR